MGIIKGQNMRVLVDGKCVAMSTNTTFHISAELSDVSTKDSTGDWQEQEVVGKSWDAETTSLVSLEDVGVNGELPQSLVQLMINATLITLVFDTTSGANNRVAQNSAIKMTGKAYLQDVSIDAANRQNSQLKAKFIGTGPLTMAS